MSAKRPSTVGKLVLECERPECRLLFYGTTRSATQRWHAESPCGVRERQWRYRTKPRH
ncbi:MAG TPA: CGNR zinc finger domain-containing protein [Solirubrobacteraceae bacterium]|nr:CGNR zinc finger domain-containing protein [Solirubrobacteraceae bacterium]